MQEHREAVLVFDRDGEVMAFPRLEDAAGWMESIDVLDGEYERAFTPDGRVVEITGVRDSPVSLRITTERDDIGLRERLMRSRARMGFASDVDDPVSVAKRIDAPGVGTQLATPSELASPTPPRRPPTADIAQASATAAIGAIATVTEGEAFRGGLGRAPRGRTRA